MLSKCLISGLSCMLYQSVMTRLSQKETISLCPTLSTLSSVYLSSSYLQVGMELRSPVCVEVKEVQTAMLAASTLNTSCLGKSVKHLVAWVEASSIMDLACGRLFYHIRLYAILAS